MKGEKFQVDKRESRRYYMISAWRLASRVIGAIVSAADGPAVQCSELPHTYLASGKLQSVCFVTLCNELRFPDRLSSYDDIEHSFLVTEKARV